MGQRRIRLAAGPALALIVGLLLFFYFAKPPEFRRDPVTELAGLVRIYPTYEARYSGCEEGARRDDAIGALLPAFIGYHGARFVAPGDEAAVAYARQARPHCELWGLDRFRRHWFEDGFSTVKRSRVRVPLDG